MNKGDTISVNRDQANIMFGPPVGEIRKGAKNKYAGCDVEIIDVNDNLVCIRRLAWDSTSHGDTPSTSTDDQFHPLDAFNDGAAKQTDRGGGGTLTVTVLGPIEPKILGPGQQPGGEVVEKVDALGPELKMSHPPGWFTNLPINDPGMRRNYSEAVEILQSLKAARKADGLNKPLFAQEKE